MVENMERKGAPPTIYPIENEKFKRIRVAHWHKHDPKTAPGCSLPIN
jgi:hypothetical protein